MLDTNTILFSIVHREMRGHKESVPATHQIPLVSLFLSFRPIFYLNYA